MVSAFELAERGRRARVEGRPQEALDCYEAAVYVFQSARNAARAEEAQRCVQAIRAELLEANAPAMQHVEAD